MTYISNINFPFENPTPIKRIRENFIDNKSMQTKMIIKNKQDG